MSIKLNLYAPHIFISWAGFARVGRMIALGLEDLGVQVNLVNITPSKYDGLITKEEYSRLKLEALSRFENKAAKKEREAMEKPVSERMKKIVGVRDRALGLLTKQGLTDLEIAKELNIHVSMLRDIRFKMKAIPDEV